MSVEKKLTSYGGYIPGTVSKWSSQLATSPNCIKKILTAIQIISSREIRRLLRGIVGKNKKLIEQRDSFICKFGQVGKSGEPILYEFYHTFPKYKKKVIEQWEIPQLPENSTVIFLDDLVGTGRQSSTFITEKLNQLLNPSHVAYLLCICATPIGIEEVEGNTNFSVLPALVLDEVSYQHFSDKCNLFDSTEKKFLKAINNCLQSPGRGYYAELGLLLAFYFTVPNNTMPFIWKDGSAYFDVTGAQKKWCALLPRRY